MDNSVVHNAPYTAARGAELAAPSTEGDALFEDPALADPLDLEQQVCFGLSIAARGVVAVYRPLLDPLGLTHPQYLVMVALWQHGPLSVKELGKLLMLDSGTLSPLLKRLENLGVVQRERTAADERQVKITVTEKGRELRGQAEKVHDGVVRRLGLEQGDLERLQEMLGHVIRATGEPVPRR